MTYRSPYERLSNEKKKLYGGYLNILEVPVPVSIMTHWYRTASAASRFVLVQCCGAKRLFWSAPDSGISSLEA